MQMEKRETGKQRNCISSDGKKRKETCHLQRSDRVPRSQSKILHRPRSEFRSDTSLVPGRSCFLQVRLADRVQRIGLAVLFFTRRRSRRISRRWGRGNRSARSAGMRRRRSPVSTRRKSHVEGCDQSSLQGLVLLLEECKAGFETMWGTRGLRR
jgi:hypothetical protein